MDELDIQRLTELTNKYRSGTITPVEQAELDAWRFASAGNEQRFQERLQEEQIVRSLAILHEAGRHREADRLRVMNAVRKVPAIRRYRRVYIAAAAVIVIVACSAIFYRIRTNTPYQPASITAKKDNILPPGGNKAVLTLDNGERIVLDSVQTGSLAQQGAADVQKLSGGQLAYIIRGVSSKPAGFNMISTPAGGQYKVVLPDGSKVWLNNASTLRYPTSFTGSERRVFLSGEAYFEVAKDPSRPFKLDARNMEIMVLGTHFNVEAYADEAIQKTTLLEGLVKVSAPSKSVLIMPGQQASWNGTFSVKGDVDTSQVTAWKDGYFEFSGEDIRVVMKRLARWYDVTINYEGATPQEKVSGRISRNNEAADVLTFLEASGYHFKIDGKTITVLP